jgi:hypothetical protein
MKISLSIEEGLFYYKGNSFLQGKKIKQTRVEANHPYGYKGKNEIHSDEFVCGNCCPTIIPMQLAGPRRL